MTKLVVLEINEIPLRVIEAAVERGRAPNLARMLDDGSVCQTEIPTTDADRYLYPSQTWATLATGKHYDDHRIYWYGDPKPDEYPLYWEVAADRGASVGFVGTLHSSDKWQRFDSDRVRFALADCFAGSDLTRPSHYRRAQRAIIDLAEDNGRNSSLGSIVRSGAGLTSLATLGLRRSTAVDLARLAVDVAAGRVPRERLRSAQHLLMFDVFEHLAHEHDADLSIYFTNHVASMMHRYWYGLFPDDWTDPLYPRSWQDRFGDEILHAVELLDSSVARIHDWCLRSDRSLALVSSMGQQANPDADPTTTKAVILRDPAAFASVLGLRGERQPVRAMVPTQSWEFATDGLAATNGDALRSTDFVGGRLEVDVVGPVLSVTYHLDPDAAGIGPVGRTATLGDAGFVVEAVTDHNSGIHHPTGVFILWNSHHVLPARLDLTQVAPILIDLVAPDRHLGRDQRSTAARI